MIETCPTCGSQVRIVLKPTEGYWHLLTPREKEVFELLVELGTAPLVAETLGTSEQTVKNQLHAIREKTGSDTIVQATYKLLTGRQ